MEGIVRYYKWITSVLVFALLVYLIPLSLLSEEQYSEVVYTEHKAASSTPAPKKKVWPWVLGGLLVGGGAAAIIAGSSGGGGDSDSSSPTPTPTASSSATPSASPTPTPTPAPSSDACTEADVLGTWSAPEEVVDEITGTRRTTYSFTLSSGSSATYSKSESWQPADGSPGTGSGMAFPGSWSLDTSTCTLTLDAGGGSEWDGSDQVSGNSVTINGRTYSKE